MSILKLFPPHAFSPGPGTVCSWAALLALGSGWVVDATRSTDAPADLGPPPTPRAEREVRFAKSGVEIAGSLTLPPGQGPFPAAIQISGAGAQDRDGLANDPEEARMAPEIFARAGIALLRTDDRGTGASGGDSYRATFDDLASDTAAAIAFLASQAEIDAGRIGLIGASQGALIAAQTAARHREVAFVVLFSGPGLVGRDLLFDQIARMDRASGLPEATITEIVARTREALGWLEAEDEGRRRNHLREIARELRRLRTTSPFAASNTAVSLEREVDVLTSPAYRAALSHDPAVALRQLRCPVLVIHGELDLQVHPDVNLPAVEAALADAPTTDVTVARFPGLNHLLQPAETGHVSEYATGRRSPVVYERTAAWIVERFGKGAGR